MRINKTGTIVIALLCMSQIASAIEQDKTITKQENKSWYERLQQWIGKYKSPLWLTTAAIGGAGAYHVAKYRPAGPIRVDVYGDENGCWFLIDQEKFSCPLIKREGRYFQLKSNIQFSRKRFFKPEQTEELFRNNKVFFKNEDGTKRYKLIGSAMWSDETSFAATPHLMCNVLSSKRNCIRGEGMFAGGSTRIRSSFSCTVDLVD